MILGQVIRLRSLTDERAKGTRLGWKADKGKVFVCVLLGVEPVDPKNGEALDPEKVLKEMGWVPSTTKARKRNGPPGEFGEMTHMQGRVAIP